MVAKGSIFIYNICIENYTRLFGSLEVYRLWLISLKIAPMKR